MNTLVDTAGMIREVWKDPATAPSKRSIARARKDGKLPYIRLGGLIYFDPEAVKRAITERMTVPQRPARRKGGAA
jgi:hypothetical protein